MVFRVLITGANKGIGLEIVARVLAERADAFVYLGARSAARGAAARDALLARDPAWAPRVAVLEIDVARKASVEAAAAVVAASGPLDGLVNNAGVHGAPAETLDVNLHGVVRCVDAFMPLLSPGARVVNMSSGSAPMFVAKCSPAVSAALVDPEVTMENIDGVAATLLAALGAPTPADALAAAGFPGNDVAGAAYGCSKALLNAYTQLLARTTTLCVNACSPGFIDTDLVGSLFSARGQTAAAAGALPPARGADAPSYLLLSGEVTSRGWYYGSDCRRSPLDAYRAPGTPAFAPTAADVA